MNVHRAPHRAAGGRSSAPSIPSIPLREMREFEPVGERSSNLYSALGDATRVAILEIPPEFIPIQALSQTSNVPFHVKNVNGIFRGHSTAEFISVPDSFISRTSVAMLYCFGLTRRMHPSPAHLHPSEWPPGIRPNNGEAKFIELVLKWRGFFKAVRLHVAESDDLKWHFSLGTTLQELFRNVLLQLTPQTASGHGTLYGAGMAASLHQNGNAVASLFQHNPFPALQQHLGGGFMQAEQPGMDSTAAARGGANNPQGHAVPDQGNLQAHQALVNPPALSRGGTDPFDLYNVQTNNILCLENDPSFLSHVCSTSSFAMPQQPYDNSQQQQ